MQLEIISHIPSNIKSKTHNSLKIVIIALTTSFSHEYYPLHLFTLAGALVRKQPGLYDITLARSLTSDGVIEYIAKMKPDILALSAPQGTFITLDQTLQSLSRQYSNKIPYVILGGSIPAYLPNRFLTNYPKLPISIVGGWGEDPFTNIVAQQSTKHTHPRQTYVLGGYPLSYPKQIGIPKQGNVKMYYPRVEASRGCFWGACAYCLRPLNELQGKWKQYNTEDILSQITEMLKLGYTGYFEFADEEPVGTDIKRFQKIFEELAILRKKYPTFTIGMNMRADHIISPKPEFQTTYDTFLQKGKDAGLTMVWMGAESYSHNHLRVLRKGSNISPLTNFLAAKKLRDLHIGVLQGFIPYHPLSTWEELIEMVNFISPHMSFFSQVLSSPFGFLRVQFNTPYSREIQKLDGESHTKLLGDLDENMLTYACKYKDKGVGLHAAYMRLVYDFINPITKQLNVLALTGDMESQNKLNLVRLAGVKLFVYSVIQTAKYKHDTNQLQQIQKQMIKNYRLEIRKLGIGDRELDIKLQKEISYYIGKFV